MRFSQEILKDCILDSNIVINKIKEENIMTDKEAQYYIDKDKKIDIRLDTWSADKMFVGIYNDRNHSSVSYTCSVEELRGLADFIYNTLGQKQ